MLKKILEVFIQGGVHAVLIQLLLAFVQQGFIFIADSYQLGVRVAA